jgi:hypothetical protein
MCGCALKVNLASLPARSTIRAKPDVVNGAPRSDVNTKGDLGPVRAAVAAGHAARPRQGWVLGVPCLTLRTCRVADLTPPVPNAGPPAQTLVGHAGRLRGPCWRHGARSGCCWWLSSTARPQPPSNVRGSAGAYWEPLGCNCSIYGGWRDQPQARFGHMFRPPCATTVRINAFNEQYVNGRLPRPPPPPADTRPHRPKCLSELSAMSPAAYATIFAVALLQRPRCKLLEAA